MSETFIITQTKNIRKGDVVRIQTALSYIDCKVVKGRHFADVDGVEKTKLELEGRTAVRKEREVKQK